MVYIVSIAIKNMVFFYFTIEGMFFNFSFFFFSFCTDNNLVLNSTACKCQSTQSRFLFLCVVVLSKVS